MRQCGVLIQRIQVEEDGHYPTFVENFQAIRHYCKWPSIQEAYGRDATDIRSADIVRNAIGVAQTNVQMIVGTYEDGISGLCN